MSTESVPESEPSAPSPASRVVTLLPIDGREPPSNLSSLDADAALVAISAPWHPAVLARLETLPELEPLEDPSQPAPGVQKVVPQGAMPLLDEGHRMNAEAVGLPVIEGALNRLSLAAEILLRIDPQAPAPTDDADPLVLDFLALGSARWMLRDLTIAMGHVDCLDLDNLTREVLAGAKSWAAGDFATSKNRLRAAFELLTQARERFYPMDAYIIDFYLLDTASPAGCLNEAIEARVPFSVLAPSRAIEAFAKTDPAAVEKLAGAVDEGWADVIGGPYSESDEPLLPVESILWQYRHSAEVYRKHLSDRSVETYARRRFGLYPDAAAGGAPVRDPVRTSPGAGRRPVPPVGGNQADVGSA